MRVSLVQAWIEFLQAATRLCDRICASGLSAEEADHIIRESKSITRLIRGSVVD